MKASKSGFYEHLGQKKSNAQIGRETLEGFVVEAFERHKGRCGYRHINREKAARREREARAPHHAEARACRKGRDPKTPHPEKKVEPGNPRLDLAERAFAVSERNGLWAGDIACMPTRGGRPYLVAATGAFSRKVVSWPMSEHITEKAAIDAIGRTVGREGPPDDGGLDFHDGQGAQCASRSLRRCLDSHGVAQSASRPGAPSDNAAAGPFFETPKRESVEGRSYGTRDEAKQDIFKCIEPYYDRARMHSALDCMSPAEHERQYA